MMYTIYYTIIHQIHAIKLSNAEILTQISNIVASLGSIEFMNS